MEQVGDCIVRHVNGRVGKRLDEELRVPGEFGAETMRPGTCPLVEPVKNRFETVSRFREESVHLREKPVSEIRMGHTFSQRPSILLPHSPDTTDPPERLHKRLHYGK